MSSQPGEAPAEDSAGQRRRLQLRGTVFLLLGFVVLACFTGSASAWSDYFRYKPPPTRYEHDSFIIKTEAGKPRFDSLYVYNIHVTDRLGDAMLHENPQVASVATLGVGTEAHGKNLRGFYTVKFENPCVSSELSPKKGVEGLFGGLQPVSINLGYGIPSYRNAFFFDYNDLLWTDMVDPDKPSGFEGWVGEFLLPCYIPLVSAFFLTDTTPQLASRIVQTHTTGITTRRRLSSFYTALPATKVATHGSVRVSS